MKVQINTKGELIIKVKMVRDDLVGKHIEHRDPKRSGNKRQTAYHAAATLAALIWFDTEEVIEEQYPKNWIPPALREMCQCWKTAIQRRKG